jgi:hypothetical protein
LAALPQVVRKNLNRPLTLAEKIVYGHLADPSQVRRACGRCGCGGCMSLWRAAATNYSY